MYNIYIMLSFVQNINANEDDDNNDCDMITCIVELRLSAVLKMWISDLKY